MSRIYLIARFARRAEMREVAQELREMGHTITSSWIDIADSIADEEFLAWAPHEEITRAAMEDWRDIDNADWVIAFTDPSGDYPGGARHAEFGLALAAGQRILLVGPREHLFHYAPAIRQCDDWPAARALFAQKATLVR
jgi:hypothetical protein